MTKPPAAAVYTLQQEVFPVIVGIPAYRLTRICPEDIFRKSFFGQC